MIKGCREPPYPSILTDATMEKLALAKFVAQESKCEVSGRGGAPTLACLGLRLNGTNGAPGVPQSPRGKDFPPLDPVLLPTWLWPEVTLSSRLLGWVVGEPRLCPGLMCLVCCLNPQASTVTVHFYGLVHWEDPTDEALGPVPCHCSPPEGAVTKEGVLHYKAGTSYLGKEHWKTCFVVLR